MKGCVQWNGWTDFLLQWISNIEPSDQQASAWIIELPCLPEIIFGIFTNEFLCCDNLAQLPLKDIICSLGQFIIASQKGVLHFFVLLRCMATSLSFCHFYTIL